MRLRNWIIPAVVLMQTAAILFAAEYVMERSIDTPEVSEPFAYASTRTLSEPAMAGMIRFGNSCAECHGTEAQGTSRGPGLLQRSYTATFRESEAFHGAVGQRIPAHRDVMAVAEPGNTIDFNTLEMMGKFLREARRQHAPD